MQVAALNLAAGRRAKKAAAVAPALSYLTAGSALMAAMVGAGRHDLVFELELHRAECEFLNGDMRQRSSVSRCCHPCGKRSRAVRVACLWQTSVGPSTA